MSDHSETSRKVRQSEYVNGRYTNDIHDLEIVQKSDSRRQQHSDEDSDHDSERKMTPEEKEVSVMENRLREEMSLSVSLRETVRMTYADVTMEAMKKG